MSDFFYCVFLPAAGNCNGSSFNNQGTNGNYWSATQNNSSNAYNLNFNSSNLNMNNNNKTNGLTVRLAKDYAPSGSLLEDLFHAYFCARRNKRNTRSQLLFEMHLERNLVELCHEIEQRTYRPDSCICFVVNAPVKREVYASSFRDRVVHHLYYNYLSPICERSFIFDSYSCRKGKGTFMGIDRLEHHLRSCTRNYSRTAYLLKLDLSGYFMSISRKKLCDSVFQLLNQYAGRRAPDGRRWDQYLNFERLSFLTQVITQKDPLENRRIKGALSDWEGLPHNKCLSFSPKGVGLPIGDLTSQLFSNLFLNRFDQYVKRELKIRHYGRYVDDFFLIHPQREHLLSLLPSISSFLSSMGLSLHPRKVRLQRADYAVEFLGCVVRPFYRHVSSRVGRNFSHFIRSVDTTPEGLTSYLGYLRQFRNFSRLVGREALCDDLLISPSACC